MADDKKLPADHDHWLVRESTIRNLWILLIAVFVLSIAAETVWHPHPHFSLDAIFGFGAATGGSTNYHYIDNVVIECPEQ